MNNSKKIINDIVKFSLGKFLILVFGFITIKIISDIIDPEDLVEISKYQSAIALVVGVLFTPLNFLVQRNIHDWQENNSIRINITKSLKYIILISILTSILLYTLNHKFSIFNIIKYDNNISTIIIFISTLLNGIFLISTSTLLNLNKNNLYLILITLSGLFNISLGYILFVYSDNLLLWVLGTNFGFLIGIYGYYCLINYQPLNLNKSSFKFCSYLEYFLPHCIVFLAAWIQNQGYRFINLENENLIILGNIILTFSICGTALNAFDSLFNELVMPKIIRQTKFLEKEILLESIKNYLKLYIPYQLLCSLFLIILLPIIIENILGKNFVEIKNLYQIIVVCEFMRVISIQIINLIRFLIAKPFSLVYINVISTIVSLISMYIIIEFTFLYFIPISLIISYITVILFFLVLHKNFKIL